MIIEQIKRIRSGKKELRNFGITMAVALAVIGSFLLWRDSENYKYLYVLAAAFLVLGLALPIALRPFQKAWMTLAILLGWVMTRIILSVLFYLVFTPVGLIAGLVGKRFLSTSFDNNASTYWVTREKVVPEVSDYEKQY